ncbi:MAG: ASCH domain-containing protein [Rhodocyclaceae bacterium]|nr:MAG: ASCH domain-containing protein [Rhodocyclaceae bacterium]
MRRMSFSITEPQLLDGSKTVTRRLGWKTLKPGDRLLAVDKAMGLKRGERSKILGEIEILDVRREPLREITQDDVNREGFLHLVRHEFIEMFCQAMSCTRDTEVTRIEFRFTPASEAKP